MWFKVFVLLRIPISVIAMLGYVALRQFGVSFKVYDDVSLGTCVFLGASVFLGVVSVELIRRRPGALQQVPWLLAVEVLGVVLLLFGGVRDGSLEPVLAFAGLCVVLVMWLAPNAFLFYKARKFFTEPTKEKPGA
jgi:hypothetical protein